MSYFTAVFKDLPQDELAAIAQDERCRFMSHSHVGHERDELRQRVADLESQVLNQAAIITGHHQYVGQDFQFRIERLQEQLAACEKERNSCNKARLDLLDLNDGLCEQLAAIQARERQLRDALLVAQECLNEAHGAVCDSVAVTFWFDEALSTVDAALAQDLNTCPQCGGEADQGHDRCYPPTAYLCSKCQSTTEDCSVVQAKG